MSKWNRINRIYQLYTSDLSYKEVRRLIKKEAPEVYDFYIRNIERPDKSRHSIKNTFIFIKNVFVEFLLKMSPIRRVFYSAALFIFVIGFIFNIWDWVLLAFIMLNLLIAFELADKLTAKDELAVARDIQSSLMPKNPPQINNYNVSCYIETAYEVGGDYFDFIVSEKCNSLFLAIGDISGKGMAAAIYMVQVQAILKSLITSLDDLKSILFSLNRMLKRIFKPDIFLTITLVSIDEAGNLKLCRAGHLPIIHYKAAEKKCFDLTPRGIGIGLSENGTFEKLLDEIVVTTEPGDLLFFYTDGITEAMDRDKNLFGDENLKKIIELNAGKTPEELQEVVLNRLEAFRDSILSGDDLTIVILKRK